MAGAQAGTVLRYVRRLLTPSGDVDPDHQLLQRFASQRDEAAFATLLQRHASVVLGVCRRVLNHEQDAEDAFQATFLVLARKAGSVRSRESLSGWLYAVAYHLALRAKRDAVKRSAREQEVGRMARVNHTTNPTWSELRQMLDEELHRLPDKYRAPLLLCCLDGKTRDEAADRLGWTPGTVKGRLERGRELLRKRLLQRGLTLSTVLLASLLSQQAASAAVPTSLVSATLHAGLRFAAGQVIDGMASAQVISLTKGALRTMFMAKLKLAMVGVVIVGVLGLGTGALMHQARADRITDQAIKENAADKKDKTPPLPSGELLGFTAKGSTPYALERTFPGIVGALLLTDEQKQKIHQVRDETIGSPAVQEAGKIAKTDPNATEAQKENARKLSQEARTKLQAEVANILTKDQKAMVQKIQTAVEEAQGTVGEKFQAQFAAAKGNEALMQELQKQKMEEIQAEFSRRLVGILTAEQRASYEKAAAAQKAAEEEAKKNPKPKK